MPLLDKLLHLIASSFIFPTLEHEKENSDNSCLNLEASFPKESEMVTNQENAKSQPNCAVYLPPNIIGISTYNRAVWK